MKILPHMSLFTALVLVILLTSCTSTSPVVPPKPEDTLTPLPSPHTNINASIENESSTHSPQLTAGVLEISGVVLSGGDQTPEGLLGGPRTFAYLVELDLGEVITLTYTAYPPSPAGDALPKPRLDFHKGIIEPGDGIVARGTFDPASNTLTVEAESDFIETFAQ